MTDEQTNAPDTEGKEVDTSTEKPTETPDKEVESIEESSTLYDKTNRVVERLEIANKKTEELLNRQEQIYMNQKLGGTAGGHIEIRPKTQDDKDQAQADLLLKEDKD